jgi:hypothetical protein
VSITNTISNLEDTTLTTPTSNLGMSTQQAADLLEELKEQHKIAPRRSMPELLAVLNTPVRMQKRGFIVLAEDVCNVILAQANKQL